MPQKALDAPEFDLVKKMLLEMGWKESNNGSLSVAGSTEGIKSSMKIKKKFSIVEGSESESGTSSPNVLAKDAENEKAEDPVDESKN